jgi:hypothetical protein
MKKEEKVRRLFVWMALLAIAPMASGCFAPTGYGIYKFQEQGWQQQQQTSPDAELFQSA